MNEQKRNNGELISTRQLLKAVKESNQDYEWYPTTGPMIACINRNIKNDLDSDRYSILDCGAGDGRVLNQLGGWKKYAIEKSEPLLNALDKDIFVVGTDFHSNTIIDKKVTVVFSNPPYSEYEQWTTKIIREANAKYIYLIIPERWDKSQKIKEAITDREAESTVIGSFDFIGADRPARAKVNIVRVKLCGRHSSGVKIDPFRLWFEETFKINFSEKDGRFHDLKNVTKRKLDDSVSTALANGGNLIAVLDGLYQSELENLISTYRKLETIDPVILEEMDINLNSVRESLQQKISGLKDLYWRELFNNLDKVTNRLTSKSRGRLLDTLTEHTHIDFSISNAHAVIIWVIKNANVYFQDQLVELVESMTEKANIQLYKSNKNTFGDENWRYCRTPEDLSRYLLDYRVVLQHTGGLCNEEFYSSDKTNHGLSKRATKFLNDIRTVATNIGFDASRFGGAESFEWDTHVKNEFPFHDPWTGDVGILMEAKAFKNGNVHIKFNQAFMCRLNVEFGRLKGWIKSAGEAAEEMNIPEQQAKKYFKSNLTLTGDCLLTIGMKVAA